MQSPKVGDAITLHKHAMTFEAEITRVHADGAIDVMAISKFGSDFPDFHVAPLPEGQADESLPFYSYPSAGQ